MAVPQSRRRFLASTASGTLGLTAALAAGLARGAPARPPNIVFLFCDDLGWGDLPCYGHRGRIAHGGWIVRGDLQMPHLDRMAAEGTRFTQFYVASAVCSPSRAAVMTGRFPARLGIHDYLAQPQLNAARGCVDFLDPAVPTVPRLLRQAGYATAHFGKWHLGAGPKAPPPTAYGLDEYATCIEGPGGRVRSSEVIADRTIEFIGRKRQQPFFINAWFYDPHSPLHPTEEMMAPYAKLATGWGSQKGAMQVYYAVLSNLDRHIGRILDSLDNAALSENTIVLFSSDNGPESGLIPFISHYGGAASAGPFRGLKRSLYEGGIRTPFLARWKGRVPAGATDEQSVIGGADLLPTLCSLAGAVAPGEGLDGEDRSACLLGRAKPRSKPLLWENRFPVYGHVLDKSPMLAIRDGRWKLLMNPDRSRVELYDLPADGLEMNNLAAGNPAVVDKLSARLLAWQRTLPKGPVDPDAGKNSYP